MYDGSHPERVAMTATFSYWFNPKWVFTGANAQVRSPKTDRARPKKFKFQYQPDISRFLILVTLIARCIFASILRLERTEIHMNFVC
jgi:hypothetical protein